MGQSRELGSEPTVGSSDGLIGLICTVFMPWFSVRYFE